MTQASARKPQTGSHQVSKPSWVVSAIARKRHCRRRYTARAVPSEARPNHRRRQHVHPESIARFDGSDIVVTQVAGHYGTGRLTANGETQLHLESHRDRIAVLAPATWRVRIVAVSLA
jgi:hypothetical protein